MTKKQRNTNNNNNNNNLSQIKRNNKRKHRKNKAEGVEEKEEDKYSKAEEATLRVVFFVFFLFPPRLAGRLNQRPLKADHEDQTHTKKADHATGFQQLPVFPQPYFFFLRNRGTTAKISVVLVPAKIRKLSRRPWRLWGYFLRPPRQFWELGKFSESRAPGKANLPRTTAVDLAPTFCAGWFSKSTPTTFSCFLTKHPRSVQRTLVRTHSLRCECTSRGGEPRKHRFPQLGALSTGLGPNRPRLRTQ